MESSRKPDESLAVKTLPAPLLRAIRGVFAAAGPGIALVGGTALAGFYAAHRKSDDMDIFAADADAHRAAVAAAKSLANLGATIDRERHSPMFYHSVAGWDHHEFTIDVVLDPRIFQVGTFLTTAGGIAVADLETLLKMKLATLVSRCSEKDLFDLEWLMTNYKNLTVPEILKLGHEIDGGYHAESVLISLANAKTSAESCGFAVKFGVSQDAVYERVVATKELFTRIFMDYLEADRQTPEIGRLIRALKKRVKR